MINAFCTLPFFLGPALELSFQCCLCDPCLCTLRISLLHTTPTRLVDTFMVGSSHRAQEFLLPSQTDTTWHVLSFTVLHVLHLLSEARFLSKRKAGWLDALAASPPPPHHSCAWQFHAAKPEPANHKHWQILYIAGYRPIGYSCSQRSSTKEFLLHKARKWQPNLMLRHCHPIHFNDDEWSRNPSMPNLPLHWQFTNLQSC